MVHKAPSLRAQRVRVPVSKERKPKRPWLSVRVSSAPSQRSLIPGPARRARARGPFNDRAHVKTTRPPSTGKPLTSSTVPVIVAPPTSTTSPSHVRSAPPTVISTSSGRKPPASTSTVARASNTPCTTGRATRPSEALGGDCTSPFGHDSRAPSMGEPLPSTTRASNRWRSVPSSSVGAATEGIVSRRRPSTGTPFGTASTAFGCPSTVARGSAGTVASLSAETARVQPPTRASTRSETASTFLLTLDMPITSTAARAAPVLDRLAPGASNTVQASRPPPP